MNKLLKFLSIFWIEIMLDKLHYIDFKAPNSIDMCASSQAEKRKCKVAIGSINSKLASLILRYNGVCPTSEDGFSLLWATPNEADTISPSSSFQRFNHFPYSKRILGNKAELSYLDSREMISMQELLDNVCVNVNEDVFEATVVRMEDERNERAGNGFVRIFPSPENDDLQRLLRRSAFCPNDKEK